MSGTIQSIGGSGSSATTSDAEYQILCDDNGSFLRRIVRDSAGTITITDTTLDGVTVYAPVGTVKLCQNANVTLHTECYLADTNGVGYSAGDRVLHLTRLDISASPVVLNSIWYNATTAANLAGMPVAYDLRDCDLAVTASEFCYQASATSAFYDLGDTLRYIRFYDASNQSDIAFAGELWWNVTKATPVFADPFGSGEVKECKTLADDLEALTLCDDNQTFLRHLVRDASGLITVVDTALDGLTGYVPVGTVKLCTDRTYTETLVCANSVTMIRRTDDKGAITFVSSDGFDVPAPATYTIGACSETQVVKPCVTCRS